MADPAHEAADRTIDGLRREFERVYRQAEKEARRALERHLKRFAEEDARMAERVEKGELSEEDYRHWREVKMLNGDSYRALIDQAARGYADAGAYASAAVEGRLPEVYAENVNYGTYQVESAARVDTAFALQDADTVQRLVTDRASYLPRVSHDVAKDAMWNRRLLADQITQGVMLGESVPKIAARVARVTGQNVAGATRVARTSVTAAECAGRVDSYARAKSMGIDLKQEWLATLDTRTRRSHRKLDGEKVDVGGTFSNGCRYPGDPQAPYGEICNCRCTLIAAVEGVDYSDGKRWSKLPGGMTYDDWKAGKDLDEAEWTKGGKGKPGKNGGNGKPGKKDKGGTTGGKRKADGKQAAPSPASWSAHEGTDSNGPHPIEHSAKYAVDMGKIESKDYKAKVSRVVGKDAADGVHASIKRILKHRDGTNGEDLYAIDLATGKTVTSCVSSNVASSVKPTRKFAKKVTKAIGEGRRIALLHNHPASRTPSAVDLFSVGDGGCSLGIIAAHDGSIYTIKKVSEPDLIYNGNKEKYLMVQQLYGADEGRLFRAIEERFGFKIEHIE